MAVINKELAAILAARYGRDVRQAIHDAIDAVNSSAVGSALAAETAKTAAETERAKAETAQGNAETAKAAAETAQGKAETARTGAETAQGRAETAKAAAETAQGKAEAAKAAAETAQGRAETAQAAAETAQARAETAQEMAEIGATLTKSWANGKAGVREGEETNNSEFFSKQSQNSAALSEDYYHKTKQAGENAISTLNGAIDRINQNVPKFWINPEDGILYHTPSRFTWIINRTTGQLEWGLTV